MSRFGIATGAYVPERDRWGAAIARAAAEGWPFLELTAFPPSTLELLADVDPGLLEPFERVSVHAPVGGYAPDELLRRLDVLPFKADVVFHPDVYRDADALRELGARAVFENMDVAKTFGRAPDDLETVFARFPDAGFCLDVAHVWTNDRSLALGHELLNRFAPRLRQLHVSGIEPDGTHRETTPADLELYRPLLERCPHVPWLLEATLV